LNGPAGSGVTLPKCLLSAADASHLHGPVQKGATSRSVAGETPESFR
jgi:hypothetical protein